MSMQEFDAKLIKGIRGGVWIEIPFDVRKVYGAKGQVKIKATFDGEPYRGLLAPMGGKHIVGVLKEIRQKINKDIGDTVHVVLELDTEPRIVNVPEDFQKELNRNPEANKIFEKLSYTHKKEYVHWIEEAKKQETRLNRINKAITMILTGRR